MKRKNGHGNKKAFSKRILASLCLISVSFAFSSCALFDKFEHRPHTLYQANILFEDNNNNLYFEVGTGTINLCTYSKNESQHYIDCRSNLFDENGTIFNYQFSVSNSDYLFVYLRGGYFYLAEDGHYYDSLPPVVRVYNKKFEKVKDISFNEGEKVRDISCSDNFLYICLENQITKTSLLYRYDYRLDTRIALVNDVFYGGTYKDDDISLFFTPYHHSNHDRCLGKYTEKTMLLPNKGHFCTNDIDLSFSDKAILIIQNGIEYPFEKNHPFTDFYSKAYLIGDKLVFATYRYKCTYLCNSFSSPYRCFCGWKESYLFNYDLMTNQLSLARTFDDGTFLIDYGIDDYECYYDGNLYIKDLLSKECERIEPKKTTEDLYSGEEHYYLSYYKGKFYGI